MSIITSNYVSNYFFFSSSIVAFRAAIFSTESLSFLRYRATTFSGA